MEYCEEKAIPHSEFLARWSPEDRAKVLAVRLERANKCSRCGTSEWQWALDPYAFTPIAMRCKGCHLIEVAREDLPTGDTVTQIVLMPPETAKALQDAPKRRPGRRRE